MTHTPLTKVAERKELLRLHAATKHDQDWQAHKDFDDKWIIGVPLDGWTRYLSVCGDASKACAKLIVAARNALPRLLADLDAAEAERIGLVSRQVPDAELLDTCYEMAERIAAFSRPGVELTKRTLWTGLDAGSLEGHMQAEGLGQLYVRLLTSNFEEAVRARAEGRPPVFTDEK